MKIQLQEQALRLRISEVELEQLQAGGTIANVTRFPWGGTARHAMRLVEDAAPALEVSADGWTYLLPRGLLEPYVQRLPCREGLLARLRVDEGMELCVDLEVDVRDSVRSRGPSRRRGPVEGATVKPAAPPP